MTPIADMVARLIAAGTPPELAATVVAEAFAAGAVCGKSADNVDVSAERRRGKDRLRKQKLRGKSAESADIPRNSKPALTLTSSPQEQNSIKEGKKVRARKHPLPPEFQPDAGHFAAADRLGKSHQYVFDKAEDMRIWAGSSGAEKADWGLTLHGFIRRDAAKYSTNGKTHGQSGSGILDAADRAIENLRQRETADSGPGVGGQAAFRLISQG